MPLDERPMRREATPDEERELRAGGWAPSTSDHTEWRDADGSGESAPVWRALDIVRRESRRGAP